MQKNKLTSINFGTQKIKLASINFETQKTKLPNYTEILSSNFVSTVSSKPNHETIFYVPPNHTTISPVQVSQN